MENNTTTLQPLNQSHSVHNKRAATFFFSGMILGGVVFGASGYFLGLQRYSASSPGETAQSVLVVDPTSNPSQANMKEPVPMVFSQVLDKECVSNSIAAPVLPFTISPQVQAIYSMENSLRCYPDPESYAELSIATDPANPTASRRTLYFLHPESKFMGMGDPFGSLTNFQPLADREFPVWLTIKEVDPYGISSLGLWIEIIGEKTDASTNMRVRSTAMESLNDAKMLELMIQFGEQQPISERETIIVISDPKKKAEFITAFAKTALQYPQVQAAVEAVKADLKGIVF